MIIITIIYSLWVEIELRSLTRAHDMPKKGDIEPLNVKEQAIKSASEASTMILRIDDVISGGKTEAPSDASGMPPEYE